LILNYKTLKAHDDDDDDDVEIEVDEENDYLEEGEFIINANRNANPKIVAIKSADRLGQQSDDGEEEVCLQITSTSTSNKSKLAKDKKKSEHKK
jgi:hypothetical protein